LNFQKKQLKWKSHKTKSKHFDKIKDRMKRKGIKGINNKD